ncbi:hypothetical protein EN786_21230 [Mesorhizobium sp. M4B.F.Ca.ET.143.01.1.1]|nr:hypothetical protein EN786_21230 [Mesorhizobium sp. M4B.F.Ca.ET.143.01.1.1]TIX13948.1 MAG: hypothetical protein E5V41_19970 [Mesorhizobium sp.]TJW08010.1 MAG: hypothetical protein E5W97_01945 [Mesorhizobium sp.]
MARPRLEIVGKWVGGQRSRPVVSRLSVDLRAHRPAVQPGRRRRQRRSMVREEVRLGTVRWNPFSRTRL